MGSRQGEPPARQHSPPRLRQVLIRGQGSRRAGGSWPTRGSAQNVISGEKDRLINDKNHHRRGFQGGTRPGGAGPSSSRRRLSGRREMAPSARATPDGAQPPRTAPAAGTRVRVPRPPRSAAGLGVLPTVI